MHWPVIAVLVAAFAALVYIAYVPFHDFPFTMDEYNYWYQAEIFSRGRLYVPMPAATRPLAETYMVHHAGKLFSKYAPGFPFLLMFGALCGLTGIINPLLSVAALLLLYLSAKELAGRWAACAAVLLMAANPYFLGYGASYFAQPAALALSALVLYLAVRCGEHPSWKGLFFIGLAAGYLAMTRPLDALCVLLPVAVFLVVSRRGGLMRHVVWLAPFSACVLALMTYNYFMAGTFAVSTYPIKDFEFKLVYQEAHGFWHNVLLLAKGYAASVTAYMLPLLGRYFVHAMLYVLPLLAALGLVWGKKSRRWLFAGHLALLVLAYNMHPSLGWPIYGARYYYPGLASLGLLAALGIAHLERWPGRKLAACLIAAACAWQVTGAVGRIRRYAGRFATFLAMQEDMRHTCAAGTIVVLSRDHPAWQGFADFIMPGDLKRNPFPPTDRLVLQATDDIRGIQRQFPAYDLCVYPPIEANSARASLVIPFMAAGSAKRFRANLGLLSMAQRTHIADVTVRSAAGRTLGQETYCLNGMQFMGIHDMAAAMGIREDTSVEIAVTGPCVGIGGLIDNVSNDPSVTSSNLGGFMQGFTPVVLKTAEWHTHLVLRNLADRPARVALSAYPASGGTIPCKQVTLNISAKGFFSSEDIVAYLGGARGDVFLLAVTADHKVCGYARQYTRSHTSGMYPCFSGPGATRLVLPYMEDTSAYRSNIGLVNRSDSPARVTLDYYAGGRLCGSRATSVCQNQYVPVINALRWIQGVAEPKPLDQSGYVVISADAPIYAIGGPLDNISSDPSVQAAACRSFRETVTPIVLKSGPWATRVVVTNHNQRPAAVTLELIRGEGVAHHAATVGAYDQLCYNDIMAELFASWEYGSLRITANREVYVFVHMYTDAHTGGVYPVFGGQQ